MRSETGAVDHYGSKALSREENEQVFRLLGNRCQTLATSVVQLFVTDPPHHSSWRRYDAGILCLVKDNQRRSYFFRLYCLSRCQMVWEHEVYNSMDYQSPKSWFHSFEGEECVVAFNFANEDDARTIRNVLNEKLEAKKQRRLERRSRSSLQPRNSMGYQPGSGGQVTGGTSNIVNGSVSVQRQQHRATPSGKKKDKDSKRRLTKADIGLPKDFRHVSHVGWDPNKGFDLENVDDPQLKVFFDKAGVSESQLQDRETREFIYEFINQHGGIDAVKDSVQHPQTIQLPAGPPPVPARSAPIIANASSLQYQTRTAPPPPPPPSRTNAHPPPPPPVQQPVAPGPPPPPPPTRTPVQKQDVHPTPGAPAPPPLPPVAVCAPPPPPPPMFISSESDGHGESQGGSVDTRSALMESIRSGKTLKHVEVENKRPTSVSDSRGELLDQIRQGIELKSVQPNSRPSVNTAPQDSLAGALARALAERSRVIHSDTSGSSDDDDEEEDDEWED